MSEREEVEAQLEANLLAQEQVRAELHAVQDRLVAINSDHKDLVEWRLKFIEDQEFLDNPELFRWLCAQAWSQPIPSKRLDALTAIELSEVRADFVDGRDEWFGYPSLSVWLIHNQPVKELAVAIEDWGIKFGAGRPDLKIKVMDKDLSEYGSWEIIYSLVTNRVVVAHRYNDKPFENLEGALEYVAENAYYE